MLGITDLPTYLVGLVLIILLPGPNSLYVLSVAARSGRPERVRRRRGGVDRDTVLMTLSAAGVASLLQANPSAFAVVKCVGAGYLTWLAHRDAARGVGACGARASASPTRSPTPRGGRREPRARGERPYRRALVISLLNPKAILFFVAFFVQFVDPAYAHPVVSFLVLGSLATLASAAYLSVLIFGGTHLAAAFRRRKALSAGATSAVGALFVGFAVKLALASA